MRSFRKQFGEAKCESYAPKKEVFAEYTDNPEKHLRELLNDVGFDVDVWQAEPGHFKTESFQGICIEIALFKKKSRTHRKIAYTQK